MASASRLRRAMTSCRTGGGSATPFPGAEPEAPPEAFDVCPVMLPHPADDRMTDVSMSRLFFDRLGRVPTELAMLENGGHFPVEHPAHEQLVAAFRRFVEALIASA